MAEPNVLPLRSPLPFAAGVREHILEEWGAGLDRLAGSFLQYAPVPITNLIGEKKKEQESTTLVSLSPSLSRLAVVVASPFSSFVQPEKEHCLKSVGSQVNWDVNLILFWDPLPCAGSLQGHVLQKK